MKADPDMTIDPCMFNPLNCTDGLSFSVWEKMSFDPNIITTGGKNKKYIISNGGDFDGISGKAWPGFAIYHQGVNIVGMVSTGDKVWTISVSGQLYNNSWTQIGLRFTIPNLSNPKLAETVAGREKMGGLEMFINTKKVGQSILSDKTESTGSTQWFPQPRLSADGTEEGLPVIMFGCHQNSELQAVGEFTGFAGTDDSPTLIDEFAIWKRKLENYELNYMYGGYSPDFEGINADQFGAMLGGVDLNDPEQAAAAQAVLEAMLMGPTTTLPPFPTRTVMTTTMKSTTAEEMSTTTTTTTTLSPEQHRASQRKAILSRQGIVGSMLDSDGVIHGQDPEDSEGRFSMAIVASALLTSEEENVQKWEAVEDKPEEEGATKTVRQMEEYMLTWVGSVNISADRADDHHWKTRYFDSTTDRMRYSTTAKDMVMNVDKVPIESLRGGGEVRISYPDYDSWEWKEAKSTWKNVKDNFTVPTGMFEKIEGCNDKPLTVLTSVYNGLTYVAPKRRNPVNIRSNSFKIDTKVISVRVKLNPDPMEGYDEDVYHCKPDMEYMKWNPVRLTFYHNEPAKAKRNLLWHSDEYWEGLEVRHCVHWNERFGSNGAWDDTECKVLATNDEKTDCECSQFGSYAVLAELMVKPELNDDTMWYIIIKWIGIIIGTILLTVFIATVFLSVVVGEMFHQIRMWCCLSYLIANIFMLLADTGICDGRHPNMAFSLALMYFYQAALFWNMCETHATFKGVTSGLINGRTSVYHPIAWGLPLISIGLILFLQGDVLGTHPFCFISWEKTPIKMFFGFNLIGFAFSFMFTVIILFNIMRVQSHNKDTVMYLKDQVKGMVATSVLMMFIWCYGFIGFFANIKTNDMDIVDLMPLFQILNGWCGVFMFLLLGMWSRRFRIGLNSQAEEKRKMMKYGAKAEEPEEPEDDTPRTTLTSPASSRPASAAGSRPVSAAGSRPASSTGSRPVSVAGSRPASAGDAAAGSRPGSGVGVNDDDPPAEELQLDLEADAAE